MNKEWSELNKAMQTKIRKNDTYEAGIDTLFELRNRLMKILTVFYSELNREEFNAIPFLNATVIIAKPLHIQSGIYFVSKI